MPEISLPEAETNPQMGMLTPYQRQGWLWARIVFSVWEGCFFKMRNKVVLGCAYAFLKNLKTQKLSQTGNSS